MKKYIIAILALILSSCAGYVETEPDQYCTDEEPEFILLDMTECIYVPGYVTMWNPRTLSLTTAEGGIYLTNTAVCLSTLEDAIVYETTEPYHCKKVSE